MYKRQHVASSHKDGENENGFKIKKGKLRGVESFGMMCSIEELGSTTDMYPDAAKDGIYILSDNPEYKDAPIGSDAIELLGLHDVTSVSYTHLLFWFVSVILPMRISTLSCTKVWERR